MFQNKYINEDTFKNELKKGLITNLSNNYIVKNNYKLLDGFLADEIRLDLNYLFDSNFLSRGNLIINTSLDLDLQNKSNKIIRFQWDNGKEDDADYYFEFKIEVDEITKDVSLVVSGKRPELPWPPQADNKNINALVKKRFLTPLLQENYQNFMH